MPPKKVILSGSEETLKPVITLLMGIYQLMEDVQPVYGIPIPSFQEARKFKPQISMHFLENKLPNNEYAQVTGEISFRLMNEQSETLTESKIKQYASKIKSRFTNAGRGFIWRKGRNLYTYADIPKGYTFKVLALDLNEAQLLVENVLDIQNHSPDWELMKKNEAIEPGERYPTVPKKKVILGQSVRMPRQRPLADVVFQNAFLHVHGLPKPICLVDRTGRIPGAIESV